MKNFRIFGKRKAGIRFALAFLLAVALLVIVPGTGYANVSVSRAEISGTLLRIEGTAAANASITVDGVAMGTADGGGKFRVERSGFTAPADCTVAVSDNQTTVDARLTGCTAATTPAPAALSSVSVSPSTVTGGTAAAGTVRLTAAAPSGGFLVALSSDNTVAATVPASVTVPAGATSVGFTVTTNRVTNNQSSVIVAEAGTVRVGSVITVTTGNTKGSVSLARGGGGSGRVTSQPAGIDCTITSAGATGVCGNVFYEAGTQVKLDARAAADSKFQGWEFEVSCRDAPNVTVVADVAHICRPVFVRR